MSTTTPDNEQAADARCAIATHLETHEAASALELERMPAGRIATARRVLRLDTSVYEPAAFTVVRPGAMDFARIPSLLLGRRSVYWGDFAMSTTTASINAAQVLAELRTRPGRDNGIHVRDLVARITGQAAPAPALERRVREFVSALRLQGEQICGKPDTGYFMAATPAELDETCRYLRSRAVSGLLIESRMRRVSMPALLGQLSLSDKNNATDTVNS